MVHFLAVRKHVSVYFDLHRQDLDLIGGDLELVWLAIELEAIHRLETETVLRGGAMWLIVLGLRCTNEGKLYV